MIEIDYTRPYAEETILRKLRFHKLLSIDVALLLKEGQACCDDLLPDLVWLNPVWYEWAKQYDAEARLSECTCTPGTISTYQDSRCKAWYVHYVRRQRMDLLKYSKNTNFGTLYGAQGTGISIITDA